jgi:hypothetical protein
MADLFFGAYNPNYPHNGNWQDINQWYTGPGDGNYYYPVPATNASNFPIAGDRVFFLQEVLSNVATWSGIYPSGSWSTDNTFSGTTTGLKARGVGIWTGQADGENIYIYGNSGNTLPWLNGTFDSMDYATGDRTMLRMYGGICSSPFVDGMDLEFHYGTVKSSYASQLKRLTIYPDGGAGSFYNPIKADYILIYNSSANSCINLANGIQTMNTFYCYANTIIPTDISTPNTGCKDFGITDGTFTNTNPWIIGTSNIQATFFYADSYLRPNANWVLDRDIIVVNASYITISRPRTIYTGNITISNTSTSIVIGGDASSRSGGSNVATYNPKSTIYPSNTLVYFYLGGYNTTFNKLINIIPVAGGLTAAQTSAILTCVGGTYAPPDKIYINTSQQGSNTIVQSKDFLLIDCGFSTKGTFKANVEFINIPPATDVLSTHLL